MSPLTFVQLSTVTIAPLTAWIPSWYTSFVLTFATSNVQSVIVASKYVLITPYVPFPTEKIGTFDTELCKEFFAAFARSAAMTLHIRLLAGENSHHIAEAAFKAVARALREAVAIDPALGDEIPSTKGALA